MMKINHNQISHSGTAQKCARASRKADQIYFESKVVLETLKLLVDTMLKSGSPEEAESFRLCALEYIDGFNHTIKHKGIVRAVTLYKELWNWSKTDALGGDPEPLKFTKVDRKRVPLKLSKLAEFWRKGGFHAVCALTITSIHNTVTSGHPPVDLSSINEKEDQYPEDTLKEFTAFVQKCTFTKVLKDLGGESRTEVYASGSQGIFGQAYYSASLERQVIKSLPVKDAVYRLNQAFNRPWLTQLIKFPDVQKKLPVPEVKYIRRLSVVPEKAHKHRIIVVSDFWSQNSLLPLHRRLMAMLKHIPQDATYRSSEIILALSKMDNGFRDCIDLKNFTDYLPVSLQVIVLKELFGEQVANDWRELMVHPVYNNGEFITYTRGQPMGLLSSWAVATLTHHYIMWWAGSQTKNKVMSYYLLGDDNVIMDKELSESYTKLLTRLDIPQSLSKRLTTRGSGGLEFCKRLLRDGKEVTPIPWNVMSLPKVERYLDLYRLVNMRIDNLNQMDMFLDACFPNPISELDSTALKTYIELIRPTAGPEGFDSFSPKSLNPRLQAKVTKAAINLADVVDNAQEILDFDPKKSNVRFTGRVARKRVRGAVDPASIVIFKLITLSYLQNLETSLIDWEYRFKKIAGNGSIYVGARIDWNLAGIKDKKETQFYKLEPSLRFGTKRANVRHATLDYIKKFILRSTDSDPTAKGSLLEIEKDLSAFIYRKCIQDSVTNLLKYRGRTVSSSDLVDVVRKDIVKILPDIEHQSVNPKLITVDYGYDSEEEFGG